MVNGEEWLLAATIVKNMSNLQLNYGNLKLRFTMKNTHLFERKLNLRTEQERDMKTIVKRKEKDIDSANEIECEIAAL